MKCSCEGCGLVFDAEPEATHKVICGDSRDPATWAALCERERERVAIVVTSPPYASQRKYDETSGFKPIRPEDYGAWWEPVQALVAQYLAPDGSFFLNIKEHCEDGQRSLYVKDLVLAHVRKWGWHFVDELCWVKPGYPGENLGRFKNGWEPIFHFTRAPGHKHRPDAVAHESDDAMVYEPERRQSMSGVGWHQKAPALTERGLARPSNVLHMNAGKTASAISHSAAYPVGLPTFFILAFSDEGDIVLDPFGGSFTTLIAASKHGRRARIMEISPAYCDVGRKRYSAWARGHDLDPGPGSLE